jgi:hypothetical protein
MSDHTVARTQRIVRPASDLAVGDRVAAGFLPGGNPAEVLFTTPYRLSAESQPWVLVVSRIATGEANADHYLAHARIPLEHVADPTGFGYSREDDEATPTGTREPLHTGGVIDGGQLVDETPAEPVTVYFSFGHGQSDPDTGKDLLDHYVTVIGPSYAACRDAMFASRFGERWAFDYLAGTPTADEWIPRWTEHERIDLTADTPSEPSA